MLQSKTGKAFLALAALVAVGAGASLTAMASAATVSQTDSAVHAAGSRAGKGVFGQVTAINGTTITVQSKGFGQNATETTYTVDASGAAFLKSGSDGKPVDATISDIKVGDSIAVEGTVSGTSVTAQKVMDGPIRGGFGFGGRMHPGVMGEVSAVSGDTVTVTGKDGKSYTVSAGSAKVSKIEAIGVSDIKVGDKVEVAGSVSGTSVTATHIMDGVPQGNGPPAGGN